MQPRVPVVLAILDGWGIGALTPTNAIFTADTPHIAQFSLEYPMTALTAHNGMVGLPEGQMGNSEVGHLNIGAGRIVYQDFTRINRAIEQSEFAANSVFNQLMGETLERQGRLHLCGLLSDGGVHSHIEHLIALLTMAAQRGLRQVFVHCFMDGRDTAPDSGIGYMRHLVAVMEELGCGQVATIMGRYWAMDRDNRWNRLKKAWEAMMLGRGRESRDPVQAIKDAYENEESDEFIQPIVLVDAFWKPLGLIDEGDSVLLFNFRADRMRQLCQVLTDRAFTAFDLSAGPQQLRLASMTEYDPGFAFPAAFPPLRLERILGEEVSRHGLRQLRIAETEKYAHVTYFFNGGQETPFAGEERILIPSAREVATYDVKPEMSAVEITDALLTALTQAEASGKPFDLVVVNFANGDMVGHTGVLAAAVKACETVDACIGRLAEFTQNRGWILLITADHGNAEMMVDPETGGPHTAHTLNPVPFIVVAEALRHSQLRADGALQDIAPTILQLMRLPQPREMEGASLML